MGEVGTENLGLGAGIAFAGLEALMEGMQWVVEAETGEAGRTT